MSFKIENWKLLILSIFYIIFAVLSYMITDEQFLHFFMITGIVIAMYGLLQVLVYFMKKDYLKPNEFRFSFGVLYMIVGIIVALKPHLIVNNYPLILSAVVVLDSILRLQYAMNLLRLDVAQWKVHVILALLPLLGGLCLILYPMEKEVLHNWFSFLLVFDAIANFVTIFCYKRMLNRKGIRDDGDVDFDTKQIEYEEE